MNPYNSSEFIEFTKPQTNRKEWICSFLEKHEINYAIIPTGNLNHIYVNFPKYCYQNGRKIKTLLAHYDRIGIGANDN